MFTVYVFSSVDTKILIATGDSNKRGIDIIDLSVKGESKCPDWTDFPKSDWSGSTGGLVGKSILICGGIDLATVTDECYSLNRDSSALITKMSEKRYGAASLVINQTTLWITGGSNSEWYKLTSSEFITIEGRNL